jgi:hypothetical protein
MTLPLVFLSHFGADAEAARELKRRLMNAPDARAAGLKVWFDKDDLRPGGQWQPQIEQAIEKDASAFVVYVDSRGVINWVEAEVRVALSRATTDRDFLFIPVLAPEIGLNALPPFARLYQGVTDPLGKGDGLERLLKAVLKAEWDKSIRLIDEPFVGLRSMREEESDRFFGRNEEVEELAQKVRKLRLVAIVADSGTGKSSLAEAGFRPQIPRRRARDPSRSEPDDRVWHVVSMRPGANPEEGLRTAVSEAAEKLGLSGTERAGLRKRIAVDDPSETAFALQCDLPAKKTATLLIVDQFEELLTQTPGALAAPFARLLLALADGDKDIRVFMTVRADYFNLVSAIADGAGEPVKGADGKTLFARLTDNGRAAILSLKRISDAGLRDVIREPLRLAGDTDEAAQDALVKAVRRDISDQPSDLPLMQVALRAAWREHRAAGTRLVEAYESVGGVLGALANEAEAARRRLDPDDQARLESVFVRLVRLGDTGGATRRTATLDEFDEACRGLVQRLGRDDFGRLVVVGESSAEIAHEALIIQWSWLQGRLKDDALDVRLLDRLMMKSRDWMKAPMDDKRAHLAFGAERDLFGELADQRPDWLSSADKYFVSASIDAKRADDERKERDQATLRQRFRQLVAAAVALIFALAAVGYYGFAEMRARHEANEQRNAALTAKAEAERDTLKSIRNQSVALTALASFEAEKAPINAAKLALAAWPRDSNDTGTPKLLATLDALSRIVPNLRERQIIKVPISPSAVFSPDGTRIVATSLGNTAQIWDAASGRPIVALVGHDATVWSAAFSPDGRRVVTASNDKTARLWDTASGREIFALVGHGDRVNSAAFSPDGTLVATASNDTSARLWNGATGRELAALRGHEGPVVSAAFSPDGTLVVTASFDNTARLWDAHSGSLVAVLVGHGDRVNSAAFSPDGTRVLTASNDKTARVWDATSGRTMATLKGHEGSVRSATFSPDGTRIVTQPRRNAHRHGVLRQHCPSMGHGLRARTRRAQGACRAGGFRCLQPGREAGRHSVVGRDRSCMGRGLRENDLHSRRRLQPGREAHDSRDGAVRRLQPRRDAHRHSVLRQHRASMGRDLRASGCHPQRP